jgi:phosphatidylglycerol:prolipoprotein diacylglycerol transferase
MHPILLELGPIKIYSYGFFIAIGVLTGYFLFMRETKKQKLNSTVLSDIAFWSLIAAFIGAHIVYIILNIKYFIAHPLQMFDIRTGYVFLGGLVFGLIASVILIKKHALKPLQIFDIAAPCFTIAHAFGRIGCFFYGCCYGKISHSTFAMQFPINSPAGICKLPRLPIQLLSSFSLVTLFCILLFIKKNKKFHGQVLFSYMFLYSVIRTLLEFWRDEHYGYFLSLSLGQWFYISMAVLAAILYIVFGKKGKNLI